jgi:hypothetical protein
MNKPENKLYIDVSPTILSVYNHYVQELKKALQEKNLERAKVVKSVLLCLNPNAFKSEKR